MAKCFIAQKFGENQQDVCYAHVSGEKEKERCLLEIIDSHDYINKQASKLEIC